MKSNFKASIFRADGANWVNSCVLGHRDDGSTGRIAKTGPGEEEHGVRDQSRGLRSAGEDVRVYRAKDDVWR
jgi:hypothetical protein